jgi:hypothetical protein
MKTSETSVQRLFAVGAVGAVAALAVNALIYGVGRAADVVYVITEKSNGTVERVGLGEIVSITFMTFVVGLVAAAVAVRWGRPSLRALQILGGVLAVGTALGDFTIDGSRSAMLTLALMHFVVGIAYIATLEVVRTAPTSPVTTSPSPAAA